SGVLDGRAAEDPVRVLNTHPALVDQTTFERVQHQFRLRSPKSTHPRVLTSHYLLSGMATCGLCGAKLVGCSAKSGSFFYYGCPNSRKKGTRVCTAKLIPKARLETAVVQKLKARILTEENLSSLVCLVNDELRQAHTNASALLEEQDARNSDLRARLDR